MNKGRIKLLTPAIVHVSNCTNHSTRIFFFYFVSADLQGNFSSAFSLGHLIICMLILFIPCIKTSCTMKVSNCLEPIPTTVIAYKLGKVILGIRLNFLHSFKIELQTGSILTD